MSKWSLVERSVNSKTLNEIVKEYIEEGLTYANVLWGSETHRESFISVIEDWMEEIVENGKITQWKIVCDSRNNKNKDTDKGIWKLDIYYKQVHCLNTTHLEYTITTDV